MQLPRFSYDLGALADFFAEGLGAFGAVVERPWHDRLEVIAEGRAAQLWKPGGEWHETGLRLLPSEAAEQRDAAVDLFPGCPLTFRLAELLIGPPRVLDRVALQAEPGARRPPVREVLERLWRQQFPDTSRWRPITEPAAGHHFSLVALVRCEIQAIDQHWSAHRIALALGSGEVDPHLAESLVLAQVMSEPDLGEPWPPVDLAFAAQRLRSAVEADLTEALRQVRRRQERHLGRELERIDQYFADYQQELTQRRARGPEAAARQEQRLAAARAERQRRRDDQVARHAVHVLPRLDALMLVAEPAWRMSVECGQGAARETGERNTTFVPRHRRWYVA